MFFYVLYKRMWRSSHSFTFFIKECGIRLRSFAFFYVLYKRMQRVFFGLYTYVYISVYLYIYIEKKNAKECNVLHSFVFFSNRTKRSCVLLHSLQKNEMFSALFYILKKRTQKNLRLISCQKLEKRT